MQGLSLDAEEHAGMGGGGSCLRWLQPSRIGLANSGVRAGNARNELTQMKNKYKEEKLFSGLQQPLEHLTSP